MKNITAKARVLRTILAMAKKRTIFSVPYLFSNFSYIFFNSHYPPLFCVSAFLRRVYPLFIFDRNIHCFRRLGKRMLQRGIASRNEDPAYRSDIEVYTSFYVESQVPKIYSRVKLSLCRHFASIIRTGGIGCTSSLL